MNSLISEQFIRSCIRKFLSENIDSEPESKMNLSKEFSTSHGTFAITVDGESGDVDVEIKPVNVDNIKKSAHEISVNVKEIVGDENKLLADIIAGISLGKEGKHNDDLNQIVDIIKKINPKYLATKMTPRSHKARFDAMILKL